MSVKGNVRTETSNNNDKFVGLVEVSVKAVNPTREELNALLGKEDKDDDKPINYTSTDNDGNDRVRLVFWLYSEAMDKYFPYSFNLTNKLRKNKNEDKVQVLNSTLSTTWVPLIDGTDDGDFSLLPEWFTTFTDKKTKEVLGEKSVRTALLGEEELAILVRAWLGGLNFNSPEAEVTWDPQALLKEDYSELRELVDGEYSREFVALLGVRTDEDDSTKQYQQVWGKGFLPRGFLKSLEKAPKDRSDYVVKTFTKFTDDVEGEYGFQAFYGKEIGPVKKYDAAEDIASSSTAKKGADVANPTSSKF